jgi:hypothetical protein
MTLTSYRARLANISACENVGCAVASPGDGQRGGQDRHISQHRFRLPSIAVD